MLNYRRVFVYTMTGSWFIQDPELVRNLSEVSEPTSANPVSSYEDRQIWGFDPFEADQSCVIFGPSGLRSDGRLQWKIL